MARDNEPHVILANGATGPQHGRDPLVLHYLPGHEGRTLHLNLPSFARDLLSIPDRTLDLLEIAAYVFAADRWLSRGKKDAVEYHAWSRSLDFHIRVRDDVFWSSESVRRALSHVVEYMAGEAQVRFFFESGHSTPPATLFDRNNIALPQSTGPVAPILFSGGIDSLAGAVDRLANTDDRVVLVSHQSAPATTHTQRALFKALADRYPSRCCHYQFACTLRDVRALEETQRTRSFLYTAIAFAIASAYGSRAIYVYENGVTSINLYRREDLANARASRTTHPKTMGLLTDLYSLTSESQFAIHLPYLFDTKRAVIEKLVTHHPQLLSSSVSCTRRFQLQGEATHCGHCFQCIDRRIASSFAMAHSLAHKGLYNNDIVSSRISDPTAHTTVVDYVRQARRFARGSIDALQNEYLSELADLLDYLDVPGGDDDKVFAVWNLMRQHGCDVQRGLNHLREQFDDVYEDLPDGSLLQLLSAREHLKPEVARLAEAIAKTVKTAVAEMFAQRRPDDERDLNAKLGALLRTHDTRLRSEHPATSFACGGVIPDHAIDEADLILEGKYVRRGTPPSRVSEGIAADLTKYPAECFILFVVYDPDHAIRSDDVFCGDIEGKGRNKVIIVR